MTHILVVEDEASFSDALSFMLRKEGFHVTLAADGEAGLAAFKSEPADLVLLDLMLPRMSGTEVCRLIRQVSGVPIIMLTAKDSEVDKVIGLELGADDYVTKPFSARELVARIRAVLRRKADLVSDADGTMLDVGPIAVDVDRHSVTIRGETVQLPLKEFELLEFLVRNSGRVLTRGQLLDRVWGTDYAGESKTLDVHINRLRKKVELDPTSPKHLLTVRGVGFRLQP